jgi:hypothetical protein
MSGMKTVESAIRISRVRLPDINKTTDVTSHGLRDYGRFAVLTDNTFWFGDELSSHPRTTRTGWYWAVTDNPDELLISARGSQFDLEELDGPNNPVIGLLVRELKKRRIL